ncbi:elastin-binding protein EbpS [Staphylococcus pseudintermedius]|uniref:elastin-binding protein EbpS n=1 Tax=Staphylococcus pseudintermedius TaxID=283734 RepID=UPI00109D7DEF|nr:elastin-binding protein EbpS [Staphylococcus pseudintermedius]EGQ0291569.1 elastin-binding protein EbpS [Staphylococcus pseudintermedius]QIW02979.1 elastin-binding protein EbpS [Staphylococcus pseudintermedius]
MSKDNFKDEFERSRQEIKSHHHDEDETTEAINEKDDQPQASQEQQFPPRNASRRHRKRDFGISKAKPTQKDTQTNPQEAAADKKTGPIGGVKKSDDNHLNHTQHDAEGKRAQTADSMQNEPAKEDTKGQRAATSGHTAVGTGANVQMANNKKQQPKVTNEAQSNQQGEQQEPHKSKKALATGAGLGATGVARAGMEKNDQSPKQDENPTLEDSKPQGNKGKKAAAGASTGAATGLGASKAHAQQTPERQPETESSETTVSNGSGGGFFKKLLPLLAAIILLGTVAIFGGMYLFNQDHQNDNQQEVAQKEDTKKNSDDNQQSQSKDEDDKQADSDKETASKDSDDNSKDDNDQSESDANNSDNSNASDPNETSNPNNSQNDVNNSNINNQQNTYQQGQSAGGQTHVVNGNQNLYRIAIQYYGNGSPENVEKIKRANGLQNNNISNGQQLIIP